MSTPAKKQRVAFTRFTPPQTDEDSWNDYYSESDEEKDIDDYVYESDGQVEYHYGWAELNYFKFGEGSRENQPNREVQYWLACAMHRDSNQYGLDEELFRKIRRHLFEASYKKKYPFYLDQFYRHHLLKCIEYGGTLDQRILFTLFEAKYNYPPLPAPLLKGKQIIITKALHNSLPSSLNEVMSEKQMVDNEVEYYKLLRVQGIILIAQIITIPGISKTYKILLAWNPEFVIQFCEVYDNDEDDVTIIMESDLMVFMDSVWDKDYVFKCRKDPSHAIPPVCLLLRVADPQNKIKEQCPLFLTTQKLNVEKLLKNEPSRWQEKLAYVFAQGSRSAEHVVHRLMKIFPGIKEPRTENHSEKITLAVKICNFGITARRYQNRQVFYGRLVEDPDDSSDTQGSGANIAGIKRGFLKTKDKAFLQKIFARCCYECTGQTVEKVVRTLHLKKYVKGEDIEGHEEYYRYSLVTSSKIRFLDSLGKVYPGYEEADEDKDFSDIDDECE